jgi:hypothetical protein
MSSVVRRYSQRIVFFFKFQDGVIIRHSPSIWNLPASNVKCLEVFLYCKMASIPFDARESSYTYSHRGPLPHLQWFTEVHGTVQFFRFSLFLKWRVILMYCTMRNFFPSTICCFFFFLKILDFVKRLSLPPPPPISEI